MKSLKNPMTNAIYIASITAIYAMIFIVSSEFVSKYAYWLSDSSVVFVHSKQKHEIYRTWDDWHSNYH